jgi:hypothetical protein
MEESKGDTWNGYGWHFGVTEVRQPLFAQGGRRYKARKIIEKQQGKADIACVWIL